MVAIKYASIPELRALIAKHKLFGYDFEAESTTGRPQDAKDAWTARATLISISCDDKVGVFTLTDEVIAFIREICGNPDYSVVIQNARYDCILGHSNGILPFDQFRAKIIDTMVLFWLINEEQPLGQKDLEVRYLRVRDKRSYEDVTRDSPTHRRIRYLNNLIRTHQTNLERWREPMSKRWRPWPTFNDPAMPWTRVRRQLIQDQGWTKEEAKKGEPSKWLKAQREEIFADKHCDRYEKFVQRGVRKAEAELIKLHVKAEKEFREYAALDAKRLLPLYRIAHRKLTRANLWHWVQVELEVLRICIEMEVTGMPVDLDRLQKKSDVINPLVEEFLGELHNIARREFNPNSPKQLCEVLFSDMGLTPPRYRRVFDANTKETMWLPNLNKFGQDYIKRHGPFDVTNVPTAVRREGISCNSTTLEMLDHRIGQMILNFRSVDKLRSTYVDKIPPVLERMPDARIHATFKPTGTKTGRLSSSGPNLQNIPARGKSAAYDDRIRFMGVQLREVFRAPDPDEEYEEGYDLIICDQSQIELRMMSHVTGDKSLSEIYTRKVVIDDVVYYIGDVHQKTATSLGIPRKNAKGVNFGFNYGMGPEKFARQNMLLKPDTNEYDIPRAAEWRDGFFTEYASIPAFMDKLEQQFMHGITEYEMISGRRRHFTDDRVAKGKILNAIIQGSSADLLKVNMMIIRKYVQPKFPGMKLLFQVHDELGYVCPKRYSREAAKLVKYVMEYPYFPFQVPILAGAKLCETWSDKDRDVVPEIGLYYAQIDGKEDRVFTEKTWGEMVELDEAKRLTQKSACAMLPPDDIKWCETIVPDRGPITRTTGDTRTIITRQERLAARRAAEAELDELMKPTTPESDFEDFDEMLGDL